MCCDDRHLGEFPPVVVKMLERYQGACDRVDFDWGDERYDVLRYARYAEYAVLVGELHKLGLSGMRPSPGDTSPGLDDVLWALAGDAPPLGAVAVEVDPGGVQIRCPQRGRVVSTSGARIAVIVHSGLAEPSKALLNGSAVELMPRRAVLAYVDVGQENPELVVEVDGLETRADVVQPTLVADLLVRSEAPSRWSVVDDRGGAWFPEGALEKWDVHGRPWFHATEALFTVPAAPITITAWRGVEFGSASATVEAVSGERTAVTLFPKRRYDAAARGWYGGDLHVHLNYSGDHVARPEHAAAAQRAEGLHLLNLVAGNMTTSLIYDKEAFEHYVGRDLPWSDEAQVARWGVEFRNDMLGHFHALGPSAAPTRYQSGHARSDEPDDWPPNAVACEEFRRLGATVGYTHPVGPLRGSPARAFTTPRSCGARELVADAALGLVDSMDLIGPLVSSDGNVELYRHLLNTGIRLAATVGTDVMMSMARWDTLSNPPGWARAYAHLRGEPLSVAAWQEAVRSGRTFVTNGPWLELDVDGHGPGAILDVPEGTKLRVTARCEGDEASVLHIVGPDGVIGSIDVPDAEGELTIEVVATEPGWFAAEAKGPAHPDVLSRETFAHTSPVHVEIEGKRIGRAVDARWCLEWLDHLDRLARSDGRFSHPRQLDDLIDVIDRARAFYEPLTV